MKCSTRPLLVLLSLSLLAGACVTPGMPAATELTFQEGETLPVEFGVGGKRVYHLTYRFTQLEDPGFAVQSGKRLPPLVPVLTEADFAEDVDADDLLYYPKKVTEVRAFLLEEWDDFIGGKEDPGVDAGAFIAALTDNGLDPGQFLALYQESRLSLPDFVALLDAIDNAYGDGQTNSAIIQAIRALRFYDLTLADLVQILIMAAGSTPAPSGLLSLPVATAQAFFTRLAQDGTDLAGFLAPLDEGQSVSSAIRQRLSMSTANTETAGRFLFTPHWTPVYNSEKTVRESGHILHVDAPDPRSYSGGRLWESEDRTLQYAEGRLVNARWHWQAQIDVSQPSSAGQEVDTSHRGFVTDIRPVYSELFVHHGWDLEAKSEMTFSPTMGSPSLPSGTFYYTMEHKSKSMFTPYSLLTIDYLTFRGTDWPKKFTRWKDDVQGLYFGPPKRTK